MKTGTHPKYFVTAQIACACGNVITTGSTREALKTELCSACHPFFTGKQKLIDTGGRVDKFKAKQTLASKLKEEKVAKKEAKSKKNMYVEKEVPQEVIEKSMAA